MRRSCTQISLGWPCHLTRAWAGGIGVLVIPDDDTLVLTVDEHVAVHVVREGIDVWRILVLGLAGVGGQVPA